MVIFVVGLMKDPRPLVQHVYEMQVEDYLNEMRTGGLYDSPIDVDLFESLHTESSNTLTTTTMGIMMTLTQPRSTSQVDCITSRR